LPRDEYFPLRRATLAARIIAGELMKRIAFFTLEGLVRYGAHEVWMMLGQFDSNEAAMAATGQVPSNVAATRVLPYFRDSGLLPSATNGAPATRGLKPHFKPASQGVVVA